MDIMEEFQLMKDLNHTNTVRVYGFILHKGSLAFGDGICDKKIAEKVHPKEEFEK